MAFRLGSAGQRRVIIACLTLAILAGERRAMAGIVYPEAQWGKWDVSLFLQYNNSTYNYGNAPGTSSPAPASGSIQVSDQFGLGDSASSSITTNASSIRSVNQVVNNVTTTTGGSQGQSDVAFDFAVTESSTFASLDVVTVAADHQTQYTNQLQDLTTNTMVYQDIYGNIFQTAPSGITDNVHTGNLTAGDLYELRDDVGLGNATNDLTFTVTPAPEPGGWSMVCAGAGAILIVRRRGEIRQYALRP
jgi:hypothetical protein